jgi:hypothetical protein
VTFFFPFSVFFLVILLLRKTPQCSAEVLFTIAKHRKAGLYLLQKIYILDIFRHELQCC